MEAARPKRKPQRRASRRPSALSEAEASSLELPTEAATTAVRMEERKTALESDDEDAQLETLDAQLFAAMEADLSGVVSDREIAQHEDELFSLLGAAPLTSDAPYASETALTTDSDAQRTPQNQNQLQLSEPSAPAFDDDDQELASPVERADASLAETEAAAVVVVAPSAPYLSESEDESSIATTDSVQAAEPPMRMKISRQRDGLVATGAPEGFPDSSPSGPRTSETPSAPPAIDLDAPAASGFVDATGFRATEATEASMTTSSASETAPSAPPAIEDEEADDDKRAIDATSASFAPSAPLELESDRMDTTEEANRTTTTAAAVTPSLSPTAAKTIARSLSLERTSPTGALRVDESDVTAAISAGTVGSAVRDSFAKARRLDASRKLYPSVPQTQDRLARATADNHVGAGTTSSHSTAMAPKRIHIKLEPFVNFEITLMRAEAAQKRQELKMKRIEANKGELFARLERYLFAEYLLHTAASTLEASKTEVDTLMKKGTLLSVVKVVGCFLQELTRQLNERMNG